jgi:4-methylaminobutanoate oxidase (formaldehyde-forming)
VESTECDTLVLGAGIAGCALAYHLTGLGVGPVVVVDPRTVAAGASGRAAGVVTEQLWNEWDVAVTRESHREYAGLCERWEPGAHRVNGFLRFAHAAEARDALRLAHDRLAGWHVRTELLSGPDLHRQVPEGSFGEGALALYSSRDGCVDPAALTGVYARCARERGALFELGAIGSLPVRAEGRWELTTPARRVRARRLVLAAGAWTKRLAAELKHPLPLAPYRTQAALLRPQEPARYDLPTVHDVDRDVYVRPEENGRVLAGDGTQLVEVDPERAPSGGDADFLGHLAESLAERYPAWGNAEVTGAWAGVCCSTPDRRPLIGAVPGGSELYVIAGFNGFGVMRAGGASRRLALLLSEAEGSEEGRELLREVDPARFPGAPRPFVPRPGFTLEAGDDPRF